MKEKTLAIIKPDAMSRSLAAVITKEIEKAGLKIIARKETHLTQEQAELFYAEHEEKPFFASLVNYMISGPVVLMALEGESAISRWRILMGATDPAKAPEGTIRKLYGQSVERNSVHGSDSPESALRELSILFPELV